MPKNAPIYDARSLGLPKMLLLGMQHMFAMFGATVIVPLVTGLPVETTLLTVGLGTLLFHLATGGRVPAFLGASFAFIGGYAAVAPLLSGELPNAALLPYACAGVAAAGLLHLLAAVLAKSFGTGRLLRLFPPLVTGPIIIAIGLGLAPGAVDSCRQCWPVALSALAVILACNVFGRGMLRIMPILCGVLAAYAVACAMGLVDFAPIRAAAWIGPPLHKANLVPGNVPDWGKLASAVIAIAPIAIATMMEHVGDICAISTTIGKDLLRSPGLHRTLAGDGLATVVASLCGGSACTTYGENTGVLALTRVYDPRVIRIAAGLAVVLSCCPKFAAVVNSIPPPVIGGVSFVLFGMISAIGVRNLVEARVDLSQARNLIVAAIPLVAALGKVTLPLRIGSFNATLTPLAVASLAAILLNALLPTSADGDAPAP